LLLIVLLTLQLFLIVFHCYLASKVFFCEVVSDEHLSEKCVGLCKESGGDFHPLKGCSSGHLPDNNWATVKFNRPVKCCIVCISEVCKYFSICLIEGFGGGDSKHGGLFELKSL